MVRRGFVLPTVSEYEGLSRIASVMLNAGFLPPSIKTSEQALAVFFMGQAVGWSPFVSLQFIDVIQGKPWMKPKGLLALAYRDVAGFKFEVVKHDEQVCVTKACRGNGAWIESSFSVKEAAAAGLVKSGSNWEKYPKRMTWARSVGFLISSVCPDVISMAPASEHVFMDDGDDDYAADQLLPSVSDDAGGSERIAAAVAGVVETKTKPEASVDDRSDHKEFLVFAKSLHFKTTGPSVVELVKNLGFPVGKTMGEMPPGTWRNALAALKIKYPPAGPTPPSFSSAVVVEDPPVVAAAPPPVDDEEGTEYVVTNGAEEEGDPKVKLVSVLKSLKEMAKDPKRNFIVEWPVGSDEQWIVSMSMMESAGMPKERRKISSLTYSETQRLIDAGEVEVRKFGAR